MDSPAPIGGGKEDIGAREPTLVPNMISPVSRYTGGHPFTGKGRGSGPPAALCLVPIQGNTSVSVEASAEAPCWHPKGASASAGARSRDKLVSAPASSPGPEGIESWVKEGWKAPRHQRQYAPQQSRPLRKSAKRAAHHPVTGS